MGRSTDLPLPSRCEVEDWRWVDEHMSDLIRQYPDQWVAVHGGRVLAAGPDLGDVAAAARQRCESDDIVFELIHSGSLVL
jgi:hypothetical protein